MTEKSLKIFQVKRSLKYCVIKSVMSFDKFIDVMGVNENYLICIFMNFNQNVKNRVKTRGKLSPLQGF